jgi:hypothetical protein
MSIVALLNESIPHMYVHAYPQSQSPHFSSAQYSIAALLTHLSATAWGVFQVVNTKAFHSDFKRLTTDGACHVNLLPNYWTSRANAEIPSLAFNVAALLLSCFLSFKLVKASKPGSSSTAQLMFGLLCSCLGGKLSNVSAPPGLLTEYTSSSLHYPLSFSFRSSSWLPQ